MYYILSGKGLFFGKGILLYFWFHILYASFYILSYKLTFLIDPLAEPSYGLNMHRKGRRASQTLQNP